MQGVIKTLTEKGFGFISRDGQKDIFFHAKNLDGVAFEDLRVGDRVEFGVDEGAKGAFATDVKLV